MLSLLFLIQCEKCLPLYNNKEFKKGDQINSYNCKPCECYGHASSCVYNETLDIFPLDHSKGGGGVCINCTHNTTGQFCDTCVHLYYRPQGKSKYAVDVCSKCDCYLPGVIGNNSDCAKVSIGLHLLLLQLFRKYQSFSKISINVCGKRKEI